MVQYVAVFDSGLGGLAVFRSLRKAYPKQNFIFFADNVHIPLGDKSQQQICDILARAVRILTQQDGCCGAFIVACGTASSYALPAIYNETDIPVIDVIQPVIKTIFTQYSPKTIGILATQASISAGTYEKEIKKYSTSCKIFPKAAPKLVPLIESGDYESLKQELIQYFSDFPQKLDILLLGCTHYVIIQDIVRQLLPQTIVISPAESIVSNFASLYEEGQGLEKFFCSSKTPLWEQQSAQVLGYSVPWISINSNDVK
ncbi:MAG: glutamate racemase [Brevinema sp.]